MYYCYVLESKKDRKGPRPVRSRLPQATASSNGGYFALMAAIVISALLLALTFTVSFSGFFSRFNVLASESKEHSMALAEGCVDHAMLALSINPDYSPTNEVVKVGPEECVVESVEGTGLNKTIKITGEFGQSHTNLVVDVTVDDSGALAGPPPPPTPSCADTVVMLDRTGSMDPAGPVNYLPDERMACKSLLSLYSVVDPSPKVGIGRFGDNVNGGVEAEIVPNGSGVPIGQLTAVYGDNDGTNDDDLYNAVDRGTAAVSAVGTNLADAVNVGQAELLSPRATPGLQKVLVLISDGDPNEPVTVLGSPANTGFRSPTAVVPPNEWSSPGNALASDNNHAAAADDDYDQGFANFGFTVPADTVINGIEVTVEGFSSDPTGCQLQARINDGGVFSGYKTANLSGVDTVYTLGGPADLWAKSWSPAGFSDANFKLEVRFNDPDSVCSNSATGSLDHVQAKVYYTPATASDPLQAALDAAAAAKAVGTQIFTIHFGDDPSGQAGQELLAAMATNSADDGADVYAENTDGDHFFISPTSADMQLVFLLIGASVCPQAASANPNSLPNVTLDSWKEIPN